ncbi:MAG: [FeFe] hydrogenase H-cluster radical SAM maturase HydE [Zhaonellaceae bacterium]
MRSLIDKLCHEKVLSKKEFVKVLTFSNHDDAQYLFKKSRAVADGQFGKKIFFRGLIEFTNYCQNDCYYCGIRKSNLNAERYRLEKKDILACCAKGYGLGFRTFVLQGGEDGWYTDERLIEIIAAIRSTYQDCAITLSVGEKTYDQYLKYFKAGADRYLLRHETANEEHYAKLHPAEQRAQNRYQCLYALKKIGYQVGAGFMVGSPYQTVENLAEDLLFIKMLEPQMVGIGPFIPHKDTVFANFPAGKLELTLFLLGILRLMLPNALIPATTALAAIHPQGREMGILVGANVVMLNLSPSEARKRYILYNSTIRSNKEIENSIVDLRESLKRINYELVVDRGDFEPMA